MRRASARARRRRTRRRDWYTLPLRNNGPAAPHSSPPRQMTMYLGAGSSELAKNKPFWMLPDADRRMATAGADAVEAQNHRKRALDPMALEASLRRGAPPANVAPAPRHAQSSMTVARPSRSEPALPHSSQQRQSRWEHAGDSTAKSVDVTPATQSTILSGDSDSSRDSSDERDSKRRRKESTDFSRSGKSERKKEKSHKHKHKKHSSRHLSIADSSSSVPVPVVDAAAVQAMRLARLQREAAEKARTVALLQPHALVDRAQPQHYSDGYRTFAQRR